VSLRGVIAGCQLVEIREQRFGVEEGAKESSFPLIMNLHPKLQSLPAMSGASALKLGGKASM
jgi:hypothetical protein